MKARTGFVSNSSSSSFIIDGSKYTVDQINEYITALLTAESIVSDEPMPPMSDICTVYACSADDFFRECANHSYSGSDDEYIHRLTGKYGECVRVDSTGDNSIPWPVQEALEGIAIKRQHWG